MNPIENALRIIHFNHPEYVMVHPPDYLISYQGCDHEGYSGIGDDHPVGSRWEDIWGTGWHKELDGVMGLPEKYPLAKIEQLRTYRWPDPQDERIYGQIYRMVEAFPGGDQWITGSHRDTLWEKAYMLVGMENLMVYFYTEPDFVREVLHRIMDFQLGIAEHYLKAGVRMVKMSDDLGMQRGPLLGPKIVNRFFVPEYQRLFGLYKEHQVLINFHSCGNVDSIVEMLIQLGANILNPVQATANDLSRVRKYTHGRLALQGCVSSKTVMEGPTQVIEAEVKERIGQLGREGGYFCCQDQSLPYPPEHLQVFEESVRRYGQYPIV